METIREGAPARTGAEDGLFVLSKPQVQKVAQTVAMLRGRARMTDTADTVTAARVLSGGLPEQLLDELENFRRFSNPAGALTIRGLPLPEDLPPTPCVPNSVAADCTTSAALLLLLMSRLGDPISYLEEKHGALVHDVCPVPGEEEQQQNTGSVYFKLHTENAFHANKPDFLGLLCLRPDHDQVAASITSSIREALPLLDHHDIELLRQPRFQTRIAPSFARGLPSRPYLPPHPVLQGTAAYPLLTVDFDDTMPCDASAEVALEALHTVLQAVRRERLLRSGDLALIDNSITVHGRSAFTPRYDGGDRWLQRLFVVASIRSALDVLDANSVYRCQPLLRNASSLTPVGY